MGNSTLPVPADSGNTQVVIYNPDAKRQLPFRVNFDSGDIFGTQREISEMFNLSIRNVQLHAENFKKDDPETYMKGVKKFYTPTNGGTQAVTHYNLDIITYIGYRSQATPQTVAFRRWVASLIKREVATQSMSLGEMLVANAQAFLALEQKQAETDRQLHEVYGILGDTDHRVTGIEQRLDREGYYTVQAYCALYHLPCTSSLAGTYGKRAKALSIERGLDILEEPHPRYGKIGKYDQTVLADVCRPPRNPGQLALNIGGR